MNINIPEYKQELTFHLRVKATLGFGMALIFTLMPWGEKGKPACLSLTIYFHSLMLIWEVKYRKKLEYLEGNSLKLQPFWYTRSQNYRFAETFQGTLKISILWQDMHIFVNKSVIF